MAGARSTSVARSSLAVVRWGSDDDVFKLPQSAAANPWAAIAWTGPLMIQLALVCVAAVIVILVYMAVRGEA